MLFVAGLVRTVHHAQTLQGWIETRPVVLLIHQLFFFFAMSIQYPCAFLLNGAAWTWIHELVAFIHLRPQCVSIDLHHLGPTDQMDPDSRPDRGRSAHGRLVGPRRAAP